MNRIAFFLCVLCFSMFMLPGKTSFGQNNSLDIFQDIASKTWEGHYVDSEDSVYTHYIKWEYMFESRALKEIKSVPELNFEMITYYYFDWETDQISTLSLLNKNMISKGLAYNEGDKILIKGRTYFKGGSAEFKKTFQLLDDGTLSDEFYRKKDGHWVRGHLIEYIPSKIQN